MTRRAGTSRIVLLRAITNTLGMPKRCWPSACRSLSEVRQTGTKATLPGVSLVPPSSRDRRETCMAQQRWLLQADGWQAPALLPAFTPQHEGEVT